MSIIYIDEIIFDDTKEEREIAYNNCLYFLSINSLSVASGIVFISFYAKVLDYQNNQSNFITSTLFINK